jgi:hypothetical protein
MKYKILFALVFGIFLMGMVSAVDTGLVAHYKLNDNTTTTTVIDSVGNYNGALTNALNTSGSSITGKINGALNFDGINDYVNLMNAGSLSNFAKNYSNYSFSVWVKTSDLPSSGNFDIINKYYNHTNGYRAFSLLILNGLNQVYYCEYGKDTGGTYRIKCLISPTVLANNTWYHMAVVGNSTNTTFYLNGAYNAQGESIDKLHAGTINITIGHSPNTTDAFKGSIDDVRLYNRTLNQSEISYIYNSGTGTESEISFISYDNKTEILIANNTYNTSENANITFTSNENPTSWFSWLVSGVERLAGIGQNVFNWVFNLPSSSPSAIVTENVGFVNCYQESTNTTNQTGIDGNCGLNYSGAYNISNYYFSINYTKPITSNSATWKVKHSNQTEYNVSVPDSCFLNDNSIIQLRFYSDRQTIPSFATSYGQCYNGSWINITQVYQGIHSSASSNCAYKQNLLDGNWSTKSSGINWCTLNAVDSASDVFEEAIWWNSNTSVTESSVSFNITTNSQNPNLQILYPVNGTTYTQDTAITDLNYTFSDATASVCKYFIDGASNVTITCGTNVTNMSINTTGSHTITLYANDSVGNMNSSTSTFNLNSNPRIVLNYPTTLVNYGRNGGTLQLNYTATDSNLDKCWYNYNPSLSQSAEIDYLFNKNYLDGSHLGVGSYNFIVPNYINSSINITAPYLGSECSGTQTYQNDIVPLSSCVSNNITIVSYGGLTSKTYGFFCGASFIQNVTYSAFGLSCRPYPAEIVLDEYVSCTTAVSNLANITLTSQKNVTIYANDTDGNLNETTKTWDYKVWQNNISYTSQVLEGSSSSIIGNYELYEQPSSIKLIYNGVEYSPSVSSTGSNYILTSSVYAPEVTSTTNKTFYYQFTFDDDSIVDSLSYNQTILDLSVSTNCSAGTYNLINISNFDEDLKTSMNGTIEYVLTLTSDTTGATLASTNSSATGTNISLCGNLNLSSSTAKYELNIRYYVTDTYFYETYNIDHSNVSSLPIALNLYYLNRSNGIQFKINYVDFNYLKHPGALIQIQRQYLPDNLYRVVEIPKISDEGQAVASFSISNIRYKLIMIEEGEVIDVFPDIFPVCQNIVLGTCELNLKGDEVVDTESTNDFIYNLVKTNNSITLTYVIPSGTPRNVRLTTNQTSRFISQVSNCSNSLYSSGGTITCNYNTTIGDSFVDVLIEEDGARKLDGNILIKEDLNQIFLTNNFFIAFVLLLTLVLIFISSGVMMVISAVVGLFYLGFIFLLDVGSGSGSMNITAIASSIIWLIIAAVLIIWKIANKEEKT